MNTIPPFIAKPTPESFKKPEKVAPNSKRTKTLHVASEIFSSKLKSCKSSLVLRINLVKLSIRDQFFQLFNRIFNLISSNKNNDNKLLKQLINNKKYLIPLQIFSKIASPSNDTQIIDGKLESLSKEEKKIYWSFIIV